MESGSILFGVHLSSSASSEVHSWCVHQSHLVFLCAPTIISLGQLPSVRFVTKLYDREAEATITCGYGRGSDIRGSGDASGQLKAFWAVCACMCTSLCGQQHALVSQCLCMCVHQHLIAGDLIYPDTEIMFAFSFSQPCWSITKLALTAPVHQADLPHPPPSTLCPMPPRYAPDASQLVCCLCGAHRLLETDARATVGARLRICVRGQPWALTVTFTAGRDSWKEWGVSASELRSSATVPGLVSVPLCSISSLKVTNCNRKIIHVADINGDLQLF